MYSSRESSLSAVDNDKIANGIHESVSSSPRHNRRLESGADLVYLICQPGVQSRLLSEHLTGAGVCTCEVIRPEQLYGAVQAGEGLGGGGRPRLILLDMHTAGEEVQRLGTRSAKTDVAAINDIYLGLINVPQSTDVEQFLHCDLIVGVLRDDAPPELLERGISAMLAGEIWFPREALNRFVKSVRSCYPEIERSRLDLLTVKEMRVLRALGEGTSNDDIASQLSISTHTVKSHLYSIFRKLEVKNRVEAAMWARNNLLDRY
ncbi:response regulator transcription factor [Halorhodospira halochloris]|uniref:helix-turn-helix transcriptional regulator n=1 Tax=Halorhodospira halochloris TaxID=1052 RepID=UPI001EE7FA09|nr:response regulator transcription factor [Halorhodospira halochloris]MCG5529446.1 response regulator transcription factor [Halorhodospira halochloris]